MQAELLKFLGNPMFGIALSLVVYLIGSFLFKKFNGFFLFQPLFVGMVLGIFVLWLMSKATGVNVTWIYTNLYKPGGDIIFWFLFPTTIAFAVPLFKRNDIVKKYWFEIILSLIIGLTISVIIMYFISKLIGLNKSEIASMLPQAATTAVAMPIAQGIHGVPAITAMACILNAVIIYALGDWIIKLFHLKNPIGIGLGLGTAGHTMGSAKALELGEVQGSMAAIAVVIISVVVDIIVPLFANIVHL
ncbi:antiholin-like protein LrgB [Fructilactobacillus fructivorans]|uniref:Antiholin-like protein LrgB n=1 Tax=Fructilactobacillus fructivorans TaxID=1614 RepID=A0AAE6P0U0_9LACO|nr:antiholin-like protein LrgB [Fructilactobacillus fructivorans]KRK57728.1 LrgB family protein [Fructilactobacillus fructivorans]KRN12730.1 LrgB family protein [Fructilactobacillus fructivorans]KRN40606.1 LrgB family protein [Fructilactobacillus fructivorans]KRN43147.1 LrgB family protein [Fructilactobacillus fructivorans]QFX92991.1 antiholin-like protein LrgB [Fructilactobacillus fructivorans]